MKFKPSVKILLSLMILIVWLTSFINSALAQPAESVDEICVSVEDAREEVRRLQDYEFLKDMDKVKEERIVNLEKEIDLMKREVELKDRIIEIKDMEIKAQRRAFEDMKEIADRAIKLAETSKPKTNWLLLGLGAVIAFVIGIAIGM